MAGYYGKDYVSSDDENKQNDAASTPVDNTLYDYTQTQAADANNPFSSADDTSVDDSSTSAPEQAAPEATQEPTPQNETERTAAAAEANANTHAAADANSGMREVTSDEMNNIYTQTGVNSEEWAKLTSGKYDIQKLLGDTKPETQKYRDAINMYMGYAQSVQQAAQAPTTAPAQQQPQQASPQNQILPSAGGNYQADRIYDPSKTYGRQADGTYVFSNSARDLQNNLAREGYYHGAIDGYFGQQTQDALNAYLAEHGIKTEPEKGSDTLTQAAEEALKAETPSNVQTAVQNTTNGSAASTNTNNPAVPTPNASSSKPAHDDAWYAEQYEKITGSAPRTDILSPERIRDFVNKELANRPATPEDEGYDALLQQQALYEQAREQERLNEINARRDEKFGKDFVNDLKANEGDVSRILAKGDLSYNRWIQDNWDDLAYTYNLGDQSPLGSQNTSSDNTVYDSPIGPTMPEASGVYGTPGNRGVPNRYQAELEQIQESGGQVYGSPRNGSVPERYIPEPERQSMAGNSMSAALENYRPDEQARQRFQDNYDFLYNSGGQVKDGVTLGLGKTYWKDAEPTRDDQYYESLYRSGETPASLYQRHEGNDNAYKYSQDYENWLADRGLTDYGYGVAEAWRHGGEMNISENSPGARSGAYAEANRPEVHYGDTRSTTFEDADQLALYDELENLYRSSVADPHAIGTSEAMASDDIQSTGSSTEPESSDEQEMREAYEAAMQNAQRARDIFSGLPTTQAEEMQQAREQWQQNMRTALEDQFNNPYMQQFRQDFEALQRQFPNYSYTALADMVLFNEEMRNGQSSYYKWLTSQL